MNRQQHADETRTKILKVTRELLQEHGYQKTTTRMIIQACGIKNSTLYHFFENKEDILRHIALKIIEKVRELIANQYNQSPESAFFHELCWYYFSLLENTRNAELYLVAFRSYGVSRVIHAGMLDRLRSLNKLEDVQEMQALISMILGFLQSIGDQYIHGKEFKDYETLVTLFKILLRIMGYRDQELKDRLALINMAEVEDIVPNYPILSAL